MNNNTNNTDLQLASIRSRALAYVIDDLLITFLVLIVFWDVIKAAGDDITLAISITNQFVWPILFIKFIYQTFFTWYYGATVGKFILKIRVIDYNDFGRVSFVSAIFRSLGRILSEMFFYLGFILGFFDQGKQTFHDKIGRTLVVNV
ncbi:RDD family protein [Arcobacter sp. CECT 8986]|uniref:RDD family protein n=1 Tax=Arcobacter sp. CECT 8986 TaxID=2044507 RepID=UPI001009D8B8|nr:RDD family protein [Arcobacter sp. CECT 8986]RXK00880.1 RDD family protein [Arcobacter sp. CECT 8986]